ncbi:maleate cis-trans isomerase family protein [Paraburkholderia terrae]
MVPPGAPTVECEMPMLAPPGVSVHFTRMDASGAVGTHTGQEERNRSQYESVDRCATLLSLLKPSVIVMAHTATSYTIGAEKEAALTKRVEAETGSRFITAFGSSLAALQHLRVKRIGLATPYAENITLMGKAHLEAHGLEVVQYGLLEGVRNVYEETHERAYQVARDANTPEAEAVFISGVGMPTLQALQRLEDDLGKPVISAAACMMWNALRVAGVAYQRTGYGRLFAS